MALAIQAGPARRRLVSRLIVDTAGVLGDAFERTIAVGLVMRVLPDVRALKSVSRTRVDISFIGKAEIFVCHRGNSGCAGLGLGRAGRV